MLLLRDIMTRDVCTVAPETSIREAMEVLSAGHFSGAPVMAGQTVVGVVTAADLLAFATTLRASSPSREALLPGQEWVDEDAISEFETDDSVQVIFSEAWAEGNADLEGGAPPLDEALDEHDVSEVMTRGVWALPSDAPASAAAEMMREHGIHRVVVVDDGQLVGIVSALDITKAVADGRFRLRTYVFNHDDEFESH